MCADVGLSSLSLLSSHPHAVLADLQQADLITSEECKGLNDLSEVVRVQRVKSTEVMAKTADVLKRHGFEEKFTLLAGKQTTPHPCTCSVLYSGPLEGIHHYCVLISRTQCWV